MTPYTQTNLYVLDNELHKMINLYQQNRLPNKILFSGQKGIGKSTMAYHLINYILSKDEEFSYDIENYKINENNKSYKLIQNKSNPNFILIDVLDEKKKIDINQIRDLITNLNKSSFSQKPRIVLIDNIELLNTNSINALLKTLEEPGSNIYFILINNNKKILKTLSSRCLNFNFFLSNKECVEVCKKLINSKKYDLLSQDLFDYYTTPGKIYNLVNFLEENNIDLKEMNLNNLLNLIIDKSLFKNHSYIKNHIYELMEISISNQIPNKSLELFNYFVNRIDNIKKFNLNEETLFLEFREKILNG